MKTLKITLMLLAILFLTVSGIKAEDVNNADAPSYKETSTPINLTAHKKSKMTRPTSG